MGLEQFPAKLSIKGYHELNAEHFKSLTIQAELWQ